MKIERQIDQIIQDALPAITSGNETLESVVARHPQIAAELQPRLEAAIWLQGSRFAMATRPGYIHDSRKVLEATIKSLQPIGFWHRLSRLYSPQRWVFNFASAIIVVLLLSLVINSSILTARLSIPGDPLFSTKLVIEDLQLAFTRDPVEKANLHAQFSRERALEFIELVMEGEYDYLPSAAYRMEAEIIGSLHALNNIPTDDASAGAALTVNLRDVLSNEISMLILLKETSPSYAYPGIDLAIQVAQAGELALR